MRDYALGTTFDIKFTTRNFSTGAPFTLAGSPVISAYPDNSTTQLTAGITLTVDFDGVTGLNNIRVVATGGNGYLSGSNYTLVITTGTVNSVSVVGECVGEFSLEAQSPLRPTTAARTLDVSAGGEAGVDWANVGSPTTTVGLSGTTVGTLTTYTGDTPQSGDSYARIGAAGVSLSAIPDLAGVTTLLARLTALRAGYLDNINNATLAAAVFPTDPADASNVAAALASLASTLATIAGYIDTEVAAIKVKTDSLTFTAAGQVDANVQRINDVTITGDGSATPFGV